MSDDEDDAVEITDEEPETETEAVAEAEPTKAAIEDETAETTEAANDATRAGEAEPKPTFDEDIIPDEDTDLLIPVRNYLVTGVHIDTQQKTKDMVRSIHRVHDDGLYVLDISRTGSQVCTAAGFLANYSPEQILVTSSRQYGRFPAKRFADVIGARARTGRFIPDTLTNPDCTGYVEPDMVVVTDPIDDAQTIKETITVGIPAIAICDSNNQTSNVDPIVPANNKGRHTLSVIYWLLANETLDRRGSDTIYTLEDFEAGL